MGGVISADAPQSIKTFSGLSEAQFPRVVALVRRRGGDVQRGRPWRLSLKDTVLLVATYWPTNLTLRQVAPLFGVSKSAAGRVLAHSAPLLAISPACRPRKDTVCVVDGTLVPTRDRSVAASGKNYRYSTNLQVVIDADSRLVVATGLPLPGSRNDCRAFTESGVDRACRGAPVIADRGYQGTGLLIPHHKRRGQIHLSPQQEAENAVRRRARARVEHALPSWGHFRLAAPRVTGVLARLPARGTRLPPIAQRRGSLVRCTTPAAPDPWARRKGSVTASSTAPRRLGALC
ncbi:transposase [Streptomyces sp. Ag109_O5-10]|uniref:transposase n=1 Tax=Streptomyces sp. Ag109_O5-10 TaxID=1855349 RepID=UPI0008987D4E|nr:transposase [Streptomyces sp. Ag109_O5-10]SEF17617.1 Helix-turn-helix of DDE superfamily endonuclease [Streptomyces sp. Ag109_O5-10]